MKVCDKDEGKIPEWVAGHLYKWVEHDEIYLATDSKQLVNIRTGKLFSESTSNFGKYTQDVTDQYCLQKVK